MNNGAQFLDCFLTQSSSHQIHLSMMMEPLLLLCDRQITKSPFSARLMDDKMLKKMKWRSPATEQVS